MTILSAQSIRKRCMGNKPMLSPFVERTALPSGLTYGLGPAGYDVRVEFAEGVPAYILDRGGFTLASTIERFDLPNDVLAIVHDKSTWARRGLACQNTVAEPGWHGYLTLELTNHGFEPLLIRSGDPIAQIIFHRLDETTSRAYDGRYQNQERGPVAAKVAA